MPLAINLKSVFEVEVYKKDKRNHCVWVVNPRVELEKGIAFSLKNIKMYIGIIFQEKRKRIMSGDEIKSYHRGIDVS